MGGVQLISSATIKWCLIALKVVGLGALWLVVPPLLLGTLMESVIVIPARTSWLESPIYPWLQVWALGIIFLKIFLRCVLVGAVGADGYRLVLERILQQGFAHLDATFILREAILPVLLTLGDFVLVPHFLSRTVCLFWRDASGAPLPFLTKTLIMRFSPPAYLLLRFTLF